ncbi:hypothetical protein C8R45DRAFT_183083 [Mycena sanguinolenta]|nr:hypothetical protein C8R45DRAFT_183083 [Mycena sanguinolenta]
MVHIDISTTTQCASMSSKETSAKFADDGVPRGAGLKFVVEAQCHSYSPTVVGRLQSRNLSLQCRAPVSSPTCYSCAASQLDLMVNQPTFDAGRDRSGVLRSKFPFRGIEAQINSLSVSWTTQYDILPAPCTDTHTRYVLYPLGFRTRIDYDNSERSLYRRTTRTQREKRRRDSGDR